MALTRMPPPSDSVLTTFCTLSSRVTELAHITGRDADIAIAGAGTGRGMERDIGQRLLAANIHVC